MVKNKMIDVNWIKVYTKNPPIIFAMLQILGGFANEI